MSAILALTLLVVGFGLGRLYQWLKDALLADELRGHDRLVRAQDTTADIAARTRRAEEQIRRVTGFRRPSQR